MELTLNKWKERYPYSDWFYSALPYLYLGAGLLTMVSLRNVMGVFSGLILVSAAGIVWTLRYRYRRPFVESAGRIYVPSELADEVPGQRLVEISWQASYECGHPAIDAQHRRLFGFSNVLIHALKSEMPKFNLEFLLAELIDHVTDHFCTEEVVLARANSPLSAEHQEEHRCLLVKATKLRDDYHCGQAVASDLVSFIAHDIIIGHILREADENKASLLQNQKRIANF